MPIFSARGTTRWGTPVAARFEAPAEDALRSWLGTEGVVIERLRRLPLTTWPFDRFPGVILLFPFLAYGLLLCVIEGGRATADLARLPAARAHYERLLNEGETTEGVVVGRHEVRREGRTVRVWTYRYHDGAEVEHAGELVSAPGDPVLGRHAALLFGDVAPAEGDVVTVTFLPRDPAVHAPFVVDEPRLERFDGLVSLARGRLLRLGVGALVLAWMVWNLLLRTGGHHELSPDQPRIVLIARGGNPFEAPEERPRSLSEP